MKTKHVITAILLGFVVASIVTLMVKESRTKKDVNATPPVSTTKSDPIVSAPTNATAEASTVTAYYFHGNARCATCMKLEKYSHEALETSCAGALKSGRLTWRVVNVDQPGNEHFIKDFQLTTRSVVLVEMQGGKQKRWKNLEEIWDLVRDKPKFLAYVSGETKTFLGEK